MPCWNQVLWEHNKFKSTLREMLLITWRAKNILIFFTLKVKIPQSWVICHHISYTSLAWRVRVRVTASQPKHSEWSNTIMHKHYSLLSTFDAIKRGWNITTDNWTLQNTEWWTANRILYILKEVKLFELILEQVQRLKLP